MPWGVSTRSTCDAVVPSYVKPAIRLPDASVMLVK